MGDANVARGLSHPRRLLSLGGALGVPALAVLLAALARFGPLQPKWGVLGLFLGVAWIIWRLRAQGPPILAIFLGVLLFGALFSPPHLKFREQVIDVHTGAELVDVWAASVDFDDRLPIVLHLVFDEMMSPGAIPDGVPGGAELRAALYSLSSEFGVRIFDSVYARDFFSAISLPNVLNAEYTGQSATAQILVAQQATLTENRYFDDLEHRGYQTVVFQTAHVDFCASQRVDLCETFHSFDPGRGIEDGADLRSRVTAVMQTMIRAYDPSYSASLAARALYRLSRIDTGTDGVLGIADRYDVQRFPDWFDRFTAFAAGVPRGSHVFAHFLVPHAPYLLQQDCRISGAFDAGYYLGSRFPAAERDAKRTEYYTAYIDQMKCVQGKLAQLLREVLKRESYRDAVIVIHGDHGSRISNGNVLEDLAEQDFIDNYGTFFAVKAPGAPAGIDCTFTSLGEVFRRQFHPADERSGREPLPVLISSRAKPEGRVEAAMPRFGCATDVQ